MVETILKNASRTTVEDRQNSAYFFTLKNVHVAMTTLISAKSSILRFHETDSLINVCTRVPCIRVTKLHLAILKHHQ
jgi:hypothetical protein